MRKFITLIGALVISTSMFAQTVRSSEFYENVQITAEGGVLAPCLTNNSFGKDLRGVAGLEVAKYFTPVVGVGVEALANFNTTGAFTAVDQSNIVLNGHVNVSNLLAGYKGQPRRIEIEFIPGIGWGHNYGMTEIAPYNNYLTYNMFGSVDFNIGKQRAWQINVRPGHTWSAGNPNVQFDKRRSAGCLKVGVTYKFGSKSKKSHNFVLCPYAVTQADYDDIVAKYNALLAQGPVVKEVERVITKTDTVNTVISDKDDALILTFPIGKATLTNAQMELIEDYATANASEYLIVAGSADSSTGSQKRNEYLSQARANAVKEALIKFGIPANKIAITSSIDAYKNVTNSRSATINIDL